MYDMDFIPQGGFEPPQADPESAVLPLHNRGLCLLMLIKLSYKIHIKKSTSIY